MTLKEKVLKLQTYKMFEGEDTVYVERDDILELLEQEPCEDCISRQGAIIQLSHNKTGGDDCDVIIQKDIETIKALPSVTPQPKVGHWIDIMVGDMPAQVCDQCKTFYPLSYTGGGHNYCPSCGSRMVEPQESGNKE
jgi:hypothetical protein